MGSGKTPVSLVIYDVRGARVRTVVSEGQAAGRYVVEWDGRDDRGTQASSGVYFYRMTASGFSDVRKMVLIK
jgi:flagellar hook assembly protein FlgD